MMIIVRPLGRGRFAAFIEGRLLCASRTPLLSAARVLKAEGVQDDTMLEMVHEGAAIVAARSTIGVAAGLRVSETGGTPRFMPWRPDQVPGNSPSTCTVRSTDGKIAPSGYGETFVREGASQRFAFYLARSLRPVPSSCQIHKRLVWRRKEVRQGAGERARA